jgi:hypothetical protein
MVLYPEEVQPARSAAIATRAAQSGGSARGSTLAPNSSFLP